RAAARTLPKCDQFAHFLVGEVLPRHDIQSIIPLVARLILMGTTAPLANLLAEMIDRLVKFDVGLPSWGPESPGTDAGCRTSEVFASGLCADSLKESSGSSVSAGRRPD